MRKVAPFFVFLVAAVTCLALVFVSCSRNSEVTHPTAVSARFVGEEVELGRGEKFRMVSVTTKLPPHSEFRTEEFWIEYPANGTKQTVNCCMRIALERTAANPDEVEKFSTAARTIKAEFLFLVPMTPKVESVTLLYKNAPAGKALVVTD